MVLGTLFHIVSFVFSVCLVALELSLFLVILKWKLLCFYFTEENRPLLASDNIFTLVLNEIESTNMDVILQCFRAIGNICMENGTYLPKKETCSALYLLSMKNGPTFNVLLLSAK